MTRLHKIALTFILAFQPLLSQANDGHGLWLERLSHSGAAVRTHLDKRMDDDGSFRLVCDKQGRLTVRAATRAGLIYGEFTAMNNIQQYLESNGYEIISAKFDRFPNIEPKTLSAEDKADVEKLLEKIEDDEDVQNVFHTMA